ncbi:YjbH domain-containing protein [Vibrio ulleungensis]|uniref:YjbH domain-containing protein n=1 Tax=Vibrio ulleungensis TaxID=2807619 RepID=A0ABS2HKW1_9VIBR|nr:YjbH domain-containing protein [Vibrio ulleungensis]MBM7037684.1 YjbH domain-containing protein [Vibrio ulleungensis]
MQFSTQRLIFSALLTASISSVFVSSDSTAADTLIYQPTYTDFGGVGLMQVPTGRMAEEGAFAIGGSWNDDYHHYTANVQLFSWFEATIRYTRVPNALFSSDPGYSGDNLYTDKGIDVKFRLWEESYWLPETSIGIRDMGGTGLFDGEFIAASKRVGPLDFTLGLGWGYLGQSGTVTNPFCKVSDEFCTRPSDYKGSGGAIDSNRWFKGPSALFGGVEYHTPYQPLILKLEYEGNDYSGEYFTPKGIEYKQDSPVNIGAVYRLDNLGDLKLSYQRGNTWTFGASLNTNFNRQPNIWRDEPVKSYTRPAHEDVPVPTTDWDAVGVEMADNAGFTQSSIAIEEHTLYVTAEQTKYRDREEAIRRLAVILNYYAPASVTHFEIIETLNDQKLTQTSIDRASYQYALQREDLDATVEESFAVNNASTRDAYSASAVVNDNKKSWEAGLEPVLAQSLGGPESFYLYHFGINAKGKVRLTDKVELGGAIYFNLIDNYDKYNYIDNNPHINNHSTPRVRTLFRSYVHDNPVRLDHLQLTWFEQPSEQIYTQAYAGYLEMMFAGVGGEAIYRPLDSNWAVGLDLNVVSQRDPDSWFGVYTEDYFYYDNYNPEQCDDYPHTCKAYVLNKGFTGHLSMYYMPTWSLLNNTLFKLSAGQFLGGDIGGRIEFAKQFRSGVTVGAYAAMTNLTPEEYGEGSYNKGFYVSIPFDILSINPTVDRATIKWEPITRDGGQMLIKQHDLFDRTDSRSPWHQRKNTSY